MTMRHSAAGLLAVIVLWSGAADACDTPDSCPPGTAPTYAPSEPAPGAPDNAGANAAPGAPLRLNASGKRQQQPRKAETRRTPAETENVQPAQVVLPRPRPDFGDGWMASVYAMDPALAPALEPKGRTEEPGAQVADPHEANEVDRIADGVRVVSADELNEIDLAAPPVPETTGRSEPAGPSANEARSAAASQPMPTSWIAGLVFAFGGVAAAASALFIRQTRVTS